MELTVEDTINATDEQIEQALSEEKIVETQPEEGEPEQAIEPEKEDDVQTEDVAEDEWEWNPDLYKEKTTEELLEEIKKKDKQNFHKEKLIVKQAQEVGETRKQISELATSKTNIENQLNQLRAKESEIYDDAERRDNIKQQAILENQLNDVNSKQNTLYFESQVRATYPEVDTLVNNVVPQLIVKDGKANGLSDYEINEAVNYFRGGMWRNAVGDDAGIVQNLLYRANIEKTIIDKDNEIAALRAQTKDKVREVSDNIRNVARHTPTPTGGSGKVTLAYTADELANMSTEQLAEVGKQLGKL